VLRAGQFNRFPWLVHGFSTRKGGHSSAYGGMALNLGFTKTDTRAAVERNRATFLKALDAAEGGTIWPLITLRQVHSDLIHTVSGPPAGQLVGDGLITASPGIVLAVQTADCVPVMVIDPKRHAVGVFHAGWRGTVKRIVEKGVGEMILRLGSNSRDLRAAIGPGIQACCYEVGPEVRDKFHSQFAYARELFREVGESDALRQKYPLLFLTARPPGHGALPKRLFLDLVTANRRQLLEAGVLGKNIEASPLCTACRTDLLFSYRAEKGHTGRMMGAVAIRRESRAK
jgi:YfiH family protein